MGTSGNLHPAPSSSPSPHSREPTISGNIQESVGGGMKSNSRNRMLGASDSKSDAEPIDHAVNHNSHQTGQGPAFGFPVMDPHGIGHLLGTQPIIPGQFHMPRIQTDGHQPSLGELYCQVQDMDARLRHLELYLLSNPAYVRPVATIGVQPVNIINPSSSAEDVVGTRTPAEQNEKTIHRGDLDRVCLPVLEKHSHPTSTILNDIAKVLELQFPNMFRQEILSIVRRWFRKRREEMSQRIFNSLKKILTGQETKEQLNYLADSLTINDPLLLRVKKDANLEIADEEEAKSFCHQKIISYLKRVAEDNGVAPAANHTE